MSVQSNNIVDYYASKDCASIVTMGFDTNVFKNKSKKKCRTHLNFSLDSRIVLSVGRPSEAKGIKVILDTYKDLVSEDSEIIFCDLDLSIN